MRSCVGLIVWLRGSDEGILHPVHAHWQQRGVFGSSVVTCREKHKNAGFWPTVFCLVALRSYKAKQLQSPARKNGKKMLVNFGRIWNCSVQHVPTRQNKMKQHKKQQSSDKITIQMRLSYQQLFSALPLTGELVNPAHCYSWNPICILLLFLFTASSCRHVALSYHISALYVFSFTCSRLLLFCATLQQFAENSQL